MRAFITQIKIWISSLRKYVWMAVVVYVASVSIEGLLVNFTYYHILKPTYLLM